MGVFSGKEEEQVYQYALGSSQADMRKLSKAMNSELNGRGGGSELMAQGTFKAGEKEIREVLIREAENWNKSCGRLKMMYSRSFLNT